VLSGARFVSSNCYVTWQSFSVEIFLDKRGALDDDSAWWNCIISACNPVEGAFLGAFLEVFRPTKRPLQSPSFTAATALQLIASFWRPFGLRIGKFSGADRSQ
jgi:hypothetical protein